MTSRAMKTAAAGLIILSGLAVFGAPPASAGSFSYYLTPKAKQAEAIRRGLKLYSIANNVRNRASVKQAGKGNGAAISQSGTGNAASIIQLGRGHSATVTQDGNDNTLGVLQLGKKTKTSATQTGNGNVGFIVQGGW